jgi:hypothetical protein
VKQSRRRLVAKRPSRPRGSREAELRGNGRLGPVGGRIVAEVLLGLLKGDSFSYVSVEPNWTSTLGAGDFKMPDLVRYVQA